MKIGRCFLNVLWLGIASTAAAQSPQPAKSSQYLGAGSCAAAACHNNPKSSIGSEHTTWITRDPHARAYESLFNDVSKRIQKNLKTTAPAHEDARCLKCHVALGYDSAQPPPEAPYFKTDGVSCESCHGPAKKWLGLHHLDAWQAKSPSEKNLLGMNDTQSIAGRAQTCVKCHVGAAGMEVDHDLIAAGHPWLHFEFSAFHAHLPRHWPDAKDRDPARHPRGRADFEARVWLTGQFATAHAALELLADRAADRKKPWPEFAEHACSACHRELGVRTTSVRKPGSLPWDETTLLAGLTKDQRLTRALTEIHETMNGPSWRDRTRVAEAARRAAEALQPFLSDTSEPPVNTFLETLLSRKARAGITQDALGLMAFDRTRRDLRLPLPELFASKLSDFADRLDPAPSYEPVAIRVRLTAFKSTVR